MSRIKTEDIETIESVYEFLLAYAAQGRPPHKEETMQPPHAGPELDRMIEAIDSLHESLRGSDDPFEKVITEDLVKAGAAVRFACGQDFMSSELVDNLNASIHLRAVLTDLFLYSEQFRPVEAS